MNITLHIMSFYKENLNNREEFNIIKMLIPLVDHECVIATMICAFRHGISLLAMFSNQS